MTINKDTIFIVMPTYNRIKLCVRCIKSIYSQTYKNFFIIVVDDASSDNTPNILKLLFPEKITVLNGTGNLWWAGATNLGCKHSLELGAKIILTLNDDLILERTYLEKMMDAHTKKKNAIIGSLAISLEKQPRLLYAGIISTNSWTAKTVRRGELLVPYDFRFKGLKPTLTLPGRGTLIPAIVFAKIGLFDANNFPQYCADEDFTIRARKKGFRIIIHTEALIYNCYEYTGTGNSALNENFSTFLKSFFNFKSVNYLPIKIRYVRKHHPVKPYIPFYLCLMIGRVFGSYFKRRFHRI